MKQASKFEELFQRTLRQHRRTIRRTFSRPLFHDFVATPQMNPKLINNKKVGTQSIRRGLWGTAKWGI
jgi:hypothetical protein